LKVSAVFCTLPVQWIFSQPFSRKKSSGYLRQLSVQPFFFGHKLQFLIEKNFFFGFDGEPGEASTRTSAG
jgi:hypothetical protein